MSCKTLSIDVIPSISYNITQIEEDGTETPIDYKEYETDLLPMIEYRTQLQDKRNNAEYLLSPNYSVGEQKQDTFSFRYCVAYRHPSIPEWILARGYWNDDGIWTPEGLWYDA